MSQDLQQKAFTYFGICPFISSENILARFKLAVTTAELTRSEVLHQLNTILCESESVIIPSHFWWRKDVRELISDLQPIASRLVIQCGPGFELKEKVEL